MSYIPPLDESKLRSRLSRPLDAIELRILGSLLEKQLSTPEYYPLTLNALLAACNQKSNREPVMELGESEVTAALERLQEEKLVWRVMGGRAVRFDHNLDRLWRIDAAAKGLLTLLFLRGPQTAGELRGRSDRLHRFDSIEEVERTLRELAEEHEPLVVLLPRRPGQKEDRWTHLAGGVPAMDALPPGDDERVAPAEPLSLRVRRLEAQVEELASELDALKKKLGE